MFIASSGSIKPNHGTLRDLRLRVTLSINTTWDAGSCQLGHARLQEGVHSASYHRCLLDCAHLRPYTVPI